MNDVIFTTEFDEELKKILIYKQYPQLLPLIGKNYISQDKKVIFIGESHYLPKKSMIHIIDKEWYDSDWSMLNEDEIRWSNTRKNSGSGRNQKYDSKAHKIYQNIEKSILNTGFTPTNKDNVFRYCSFYNYFQRPAKTGISISNTPLDDEIAFNTFEENYNILGFTYAIFASKKAYSSFRQMKEKMNPNLEVNIFTIPHPGSVWWNRKCEKYSNEENHPISGREKFELILKKNKLFCI